METTSAYGSMFTTEEKGVSKATILVSSILLLGASQAHSDVSATKVSTEALLGCSNAGQRVVTIRAIWSAEGVPPRAQLMLNVLASDAEQAAPDAPFSVDLRKTTPSMYHLMSACETAGPHAHCAPPQKLEWAKMTMSSGKLREGQSISGQVTFKSDGFPLPQSFSFNSVAVQSFMNGKSCG